jgi:hypothetical protein
MKDDFHFRDKRDKERRRPMMTILGSRSENNKVEKKGILFNLLHYSAVSALLVYTQGGKEARGEKSEATVKEPVQPLANTNAVTSQHPSASELSLYLH